MGAQMTEKRPASRHAKRWDVEIEQWDEDGFHGTDSWLGGTNLATVLREAAEAAEGDAYPDTMKLVITVKRERLT